MTAKKSADLNPETFDLDSWIDGFVRPETTVLLYADDAHFRAEVERIESLIPVAEKTKPEDRGLDDPTVESLAAELTQLRAERDAKALQVRIRQLTRAETREIIRAHGDDGDDLDRTLEVIASATVEPHFTAAQLRRLYERDQTGESMVDQLVGASLALGNGLPVPS